MLDLTLNTVLEHLKKIDEDLKRHEESIKNLELKNKCRTGLKKDNTPDTITNTNIDDTFHRIESSLKKCPELDDNLENLDNWILNIKCKAGSFANYLNTSSEAVHKEVYYKKLRMCILQTVKEKIYNKIESIENIDQIIEFLKEEKIKENKAKIKSIENSIQQSKFYIFMNFEESLLDLLDKYDQLKKLGIEKNEEEIINEFVKIIPSNYVEEASKLIDPSNMPIKNVLLLISFIQMKKEENSKKFTFYDPNTLRHHYNETARFKKINSNYYIKIKSKRMMAKLKEKDVSKVIEKNEIKIENLEDKKKLNIEAEIDDIENKKKSKINAKINNLEAKKKEKIENRVENKAVKKENKEEKKMKNKEELKKDAKMKITEEKKKAIEFSKDIRNENKIQQNLSKPNVVDIKNEEKKEFKYQPIKVVTEKDKDKVVTEKMDDKDNMKFIYTKKNEMNVKYNFNFFPENNESNQYNFNFNPIPKNSRKIAEIKKKRVPKTTSKKNIIKITEIKNEKNEIEK